MRLDGAARGDPEARILQGLPAVDRGFRREISLSAEEGKVETRLTNGEQKMAWSEDSVL